MKNEILSVHEEGVRVSTQYRVCEKRLISLLQKMSALKGCYEFGYKSLFDYVTKEWKLSPDVTYTLIRIARVSLAVPLLKEKLEKEEIPLAQARMIAPILTP